MSLKYECERCGSQSENRSDLRVLHITEKCMGFIERVTWRICGDYCEACMTKIKDLVEEWEGK